MMMTLVLALPSLLLVRGAGATTGPFDNDGLRQAVLEWCEDSDKAKTKYGGVIGDWDVSRVTDMTELFCSEWGPRCLNYNPKADTFNDRDVP